MADEPLEAMEKEYAFSELSSAFGPTEFADALSQSLNTHGTATQKVLGSHGLVNRYQRIAQEKYAFVLTILIPGQSNSNDHRRHG